jgi:hypothetical protein
MDRVEGRVRQMRILVITAALAATAALAFGAGSAAAAKSCGGKIIDDWYVDNTINGQYPARCYRQALGRVNDQMRIYSNLPDELERGLRAAVAREGVLGTRTTKIQLSRSTQSRKSSGPIQRVLGELGPDRADSIPIPLMILAGVALLLIAAGAASAIVRRLNGRRTPS